jgi:site-specific DNA-methyltransferase (adenine-specific)
MSVNLKQSDCLNLINKFKFDCIVTDPPFNIGYKYKSYKDKIKEEDYYLMLKQIISNNPAVIIHYPEQMHKLTLTLGRCPERIVSWVYNSNTAKQHRVIAFYGVNPDFKKMGQDYKNPNDKRIKERIKQGKRARLYDWWNINQVKNVSKKHNHPCEMPLKVMENIIGILPDDIKTIYDPFMGTGTTGVACKKFNKGFIGVEIDSDYFEIAKKRIKELKEGV